MGRRLLLARAGWLRVQGDLRVAVAAARLGGLLPGFRGLAPTAKRRGRCAANSRRAARVISSRRSVMTTLTCRRCAAEFERNASISWKSPIRTVSGTDSNRSSPIGVRPLNRFLTPIGLTGRCGAKSITVRGWIQVVRSDFRACVRVGQMLPKGTSQTSRFRPLTPRSRARNITDSPTTASRLVRVCFRGIIPGNRGCSLPDVLAWRARQKIAWQARHAVRH